MIAVDEAWVVMARPAPLPPALAAWLDADDHAHVERRRRLADRQLAASSRLVQRWALGMAIGAEPGALRFAADPRGRPHLATPAACGLSFSATNTEGLVGCAVVRGGEVGLDAEPLHRTLPQELLAGCCSARERAALAALAPAEQGAWFHRLWTLKESWFKARGAGIDRDPSAVGFAFDARDATIRPEPGPAVDWWFRLLVASPTHALALCTDRPARLRPCWIAWDAAGQIEVAEVGDPGPL